MGYKDTTQPSPHQLKSSHSQSHLHNIVYTTLSAFQTTIANNTFNMFFKTAIFSAFALAYANGAMAAALPAQDGEVSIMIATTACESWCPVLGSTTIS